MVTPLDVGLLQRFDVVFPFLFVFVLTYAVLTRVEWLLKDKQFIALLAAFALAVMTLFSRIAVKTINRMAPWFVLLIIFGILFIVAFHAFGIQEKTIGDILTSKEHGTTFANWVIALMLIIGLGSLASVVSEEVGFTQLPEGGVSETGVAEPVGFWATIFHPKILGFALIMLIAMFTISKLAGKTET